LESVVLVVSATIGGTILVRGAVLTHDHLRVHAMILIHVLVTHDIVRRFGDIVGTLDDLIDNVHVIHLAIADDICHMIGLTVTNNVTVMVHHLVVHDICHMIGLTVTNNVTERVWHIVSTIRSVVGTPAPHAVDLLHHPRDDGVDFLALVGGHGLILYVVGRARPRPCNNRSGRERESGDPDDEQTSHCDPP
jgi:hypothetical protein